MTAKQKPRFKVGQVVSYRGEDRYFKITEIIPYFATEAEKVTSWLYRERWSEHKELDLRPLTKREKGKA